MPVGRQDTSAIGDHASVSGDTAYRHRHADAEFARQWAEAEEEAIDSLKQGAWRRCRDGVDRPMFHQSAVCGQLCKYSDRTPELRLKSHRPDKYKDRTSDEPMGLGGGPIPVAPVAANLAQLSDEEIARLSHERIRGADPTST